MTFNTALFNQREHDRTMDRISLLARQGSRLGEIEEVKFELNFAFIAGQSDYEAALDLQAMFGYNHMQALRVVAAYREMLEEDNHELDTL